MDISEKHVASKRRVGSLHGKPVIELVTHGGLHLVVVEKSGKTEVIGSGPHRAVARYIAEKREPSLVYTELSKSDFLGMESILSVAPRYEALVDKLNDLLNRE